MIKDILIENKFNFILIYFFIIIQYCIFSLNPFLLGQAIDGLLQSEKTNLFYYLIAEISVLFIGFFLKRYDTKIFMKIFIQKSIKIIKILRNKNVNSGKIISRYQLVGYYIDFFEFYLPQILNAFINAFTSLFMLYYIDYRIGSISTFLFILMIYNNKIISYKTQKVDLDIQHTKENITQNLMENQEYENNLKILGKNYIKKSNLDALNFFFNDSISIFMHISIMLMFVYTQPSIGEITSTLMYVDKLYGTTFNIFYFFIFMRGIENTNKLLGNEYGHKPKI
jgi:ABC-type multidrug transport system fused ATPase/permease subunit